MLVCRSLVSDLPPFHHLHQPTKDNFRQIHFFRPDACAAANILFPISIIFCYNFVIAKMCYYWTGRTSLATESTSCILPQILIIITPASSFKYTIAPAGISALPQQFFDYFLYGGIILPPYMFILLKLFFMLTLLTSFSAIYRPIHFL